MMTGTDQTELASGDVFVIENDGTAEIRETPVDGVDHHVIDGKADLRVYRIDLVFVGRKSRCGQQHQSEIDSGSYTATCDAISIDYHSRIGRHRTERT